jgi:hypothetical protein
LDYPTLYTHTHTPSPAYTAPPSKKVGSQNRKAKNVNRQNSPKLHSNLNFNKFGHAGNSEGHKKYDRTSSTYVKKITCFIPFFFIEKHQMKEQ